MAIPGFGEIAEQLRRSTVLIHSGGRGSGSGVIWSSNGLLVTNAHVVRSVRPKVQLWDGREFEAAVQSRDPFRDLAQLRIDARNLPAASAADSSQLRPGELAIAIGNPMGFVGALATGVIHGVGPLRGLGSHSWVQAEVRLAPGNSGGPLADARGRVVGINTMVAGRLALAIPSNAVRDFLSASPSNGRLGVTIHPVFLPRPASRSKSFGLVVLAVQPDSPAALASLLPGARFRAAVPAFCGSNFSAAITSESAASPCNLEIRCRQGAPSRRDLRFHCRGFPARALRLGKPAGVPPHGSRRELRQS